MKNRIVFAAAFAIGLIVVAWVGWGFVGSSWLAFWMTLVIAAVYLLGAFELRQFRAATATLTSPALRNRIFEVTGPRALSFAEAVDIIADVLHQYDL